MKTKIVLLIHLFVLAERTRAGDMPWPEGDGIVFDHQPIQTGGPPSDTEFLDSFGNPFWQQVADNILLAQPATIRRVVWWGFHNLNNSPATETFRIRFNDVRPSDGLPGIILSEEMFVNPVRVATGEQILDFTLSDEYLYQVDLLQPYTLASGTPYWIEIAQIGDVSTMFRWEFAFEEQDSFARISPIVPNWGYSATNGDLAFQLWTIPEPATSLLLAPALRCAVDEPFWYNQTRSPVTEGLYEDQNRSLDSIPRPNWTRSRSRHSLARKRSLCSSTADSGGRTTIRHVVPNKPRSAVLATGGREHPAF